VTRCLCGRIEYVNMIVKRWYVETLDVRAIRAAPPDVGPVAIRAIRVIRG